MKNVTFSGNTVMRFLKPSVLALLFAGIVQTATAQSADKAKETPVEVKYLGNVEGNPLFQISFNNALSEEVAVTLRDEDGYVLYSDVSKEKTYLRKIQLNDVYWDAAKLKLTLRTKRDSQTQTFFITRNTRVVEDVAVVNL